jgi:flagellar motor switch protein FliM
MTHHSHDIDTTDDAILREARERIGEAATLAALSVMGDDERGRVAARLGVDAPPGGGPLDAEGMAAIRAWRAAVAVAAASRVWDNLAKVDPVYLANYLKNEYPQTVAVVLGRVPPETAAGVLALLPENFAMEVQLRMLRLSPVHAEVVEDLALVIHMDFLSVLRSSPHRDNHEVVADIYARMEPSAAARLLSGLDERNRESARRVRGGLFFFDMLPWLGDDAAAVLAEASDGDIAVALRDCRAETRSFVMGRLGERAGAVVDKLRTSEGATVRDAEEAKDRIVGVARRMIDDGTASLDGWSGRHVLSRVEDVVAAAPGRREAAAALAAKAAARPPGGVLEAEWAALLADSAGPGGRGKGGKARILTDDEIGSLLGFDDDRAGGDDGRQGIRAVVNSALVAYERLPMLEVVLDRLVRMMSTSLRNFFGDNVEVSIDNILTLRFGDYLNSIPLPAMLGAFKAEEWDNYGLAVLDSSLIYSTVDVLLGGRRGTAAMRIEGRPYTLIERRLIERLQNVVLADLSAAFDPISPVTFRFDRIETNPRFAAISRPGNAAIVAKLRVDMEDRGGRMEILLPYATLEPVRELLAQMFMGEKFGRDAIWETHLAEELSATRIPVQAVLCEQPGRLGEVAAWEVGDLIPLDAVPGGPILLRSGGAPLGLARAARRNGRFAALVEMVKTGA